jgi:hypothetical protein
MTEKHPLVKLVFPVEGFQRQLDEATERGFLSHVLVEIDGTNLYPVCFYAIDELRGQFIEDPRYPYPVVAEPGMIVLPEITLDRMEDAVRWLCEKGYFRHMRPLSQEQLLRAKTCFDWPP